MLPVKWRGHTVSWNQEMNEGDQHTEISSRHQRINCDHIGEPAAEEGCGDRSDGREGRKNKRHLCQNIEPVQTSQDGTKCANQHSCKQTDCRQVQAGVSDPLKASAHPQNSDHLMVKTQKNKGTDCRREALHNQRGVDALNQGFAVL